jgi:hypothetical protein
MRGEVPALWGLFNEVPTCEQRLRAIVVAGGEVYLC